MSDMVRVLKELIVTHENDTPQNRYDAEIALHEKGATVFQHIARYNIASDTTMLQSHGFVVESV